MKTLLFQLVLLLMGTTFPLQAQEAAIEKKMEIPELQSYQQIFNHLRSVNNDVTEKYSFIRVRVVLGKCHIIERVNL